jgi:hypothetical protein
MSTGPEREHISPRTITARQPEVTDSMSKHRPYRRTITDG